MTTLLVFDGALAGAMAGIQDGRQYNGSNPATPPTSIVTAANAFALQFLAANAALGGSAMVDVTTNIALVCYAAAFAEMSGRNYTSSTSTDYANQATAAVAVAKAASLLLT
jgi:hypothetical protein